MSNSWRPSPPLPQMESFEDGNFDVGDVRGFGPPEGYGAGGSPFLPAGNEGAPSTSMVNPQNPLGRSHFWHESEFRLNERGSEDQYRFPPEHQGGWNSNHPSAAPNSEFPAYYSSVYQQQHQQHQQMQQHQLNQAATGYHHLDQTLHQLQQTDNTDALCFNALYNQVGAKHKAYADHQGNHAIEGNIMSHFAKYAPAAQKRAPKQRLRWTPDLHANFVSAVDTLGGPKMATPKAILKEMGVPGMTVYHVKSHLQKFRMHTKQREREETKSKSKASASSKAPVFEMKEEVAVKLQDKAGESSTKLGGGIEPLKPGSQTISSALLKGHLESQGGKNSEMHLRLQEQLKLQQQLQHSIEEHGKYLSSLISEQETNEIASRKVKEEEEG
eukprot:CAMPEP_0197477250 /NCGR_PEP_ID=MMETSP1309-20131121/15203_1 /TAXON_ID=464262 /ORGANISM="Genus nov. species nov., Strain RCC998" /LENGTH=384 /DNA_ID=CAMNT_0043018101 /DNA_START=129 /DNA_END=1279 /DNA_ORIENTATION=-